MSGLFSFGSKEKPKTAKGEKKLQGFPRTFPCSFHEFKNKPEIHTLSSLLSEIARDGKKEIRSGKRDVERQRITLQREQKRVELEIKKAARQGNEGVVRTLAKQLIQLRAQDAKLLGFSANMGSMEMQMTSMAATSSMSDAMAKAAGALKQQNQHLQRSNMVGVARDFSMANERMGMTQEMMDDTLADAFEDDEMAEEDLISQVLGEVGVERTAALAGVGAAPLGAGGHVATPAAAAGSTSRVAVPAGAGGGDGGVNKIMREMGL
jgi:charged multivesicular body protein 2B